MELKKYLENYSRTADVYLKTYFSIKKKETWKIDPLATEAIDNLEQFIYGGKKVRGALTVLGYEMVGGKNIKDILPISAAIEIMHSALLIHDDFIDNDEFRRGKPTVHKIYEKGQDAHYGASMSLLVGDIGIYLGHQIFSQSNFDSLLITKSLREYGKLLTNTVYGEILDIAYDHKDQVTWDDLIKVRIYKTAHYTFVMPLTIGAILGGANEKTIKNIENYGEPIGIGFQIRDDVLGVFGDPEVMGKSNESDIKDGKRTFLYLKTLELVNKEQRKFLTRKYGAKNLNKVDLEKIRSIMKDCGALEYSQNLAKELVEKGREYAKYIALAKKHRQLLENFADFVVTRSK